MDNNRIRFQGRVGFVLVAVALLLTLVVAPAAASQSATQVTCVPYRTSGAVGREGGMLALRSADGSAAPVQAIISSQATSLRTMRNGGSPTHVSYVRTDCQGRESGLLSGR